MKAIRKIVILTIPKIGIPRATVSTVADDKLKLSLAELADACQP